MELWKFRPHLIFVRGFDLCTIYAILLKVWTRCSLVLLWGGVDPHNAYLDSPARLAARRVTARWFDYAVSHTKEGADYLREVIQIPSRKLTQYPYQPADRSTLSQGSRRNGESASLPRPVFLYVGRLIREKRPFTLSSRPARCSRGSKAGDFSVAIVGSGPGRSASSHGGAHPRGRRPHHLVRRG